jgi:hypothetical protein
MALQQPIFQENDTTDQHAIQLRTMIRDMYTSKSGVLKLNDLLVSQRGAGANLSVDIAVGAALVPGTVVTHQGFYYCFNDAIFNLTGFTADVSNPRIVSVILKVRDSLYSGANNDAVFEAVHGTPASSPVAPDLVALGHTNYLLLANVTLAANDTSITSGEISNQTTITKTYGAPIVCTSGTRPASPFEGQFIYETDTDRVYAYNGAAWIYIAGGNPLYGARASHSAGGTLAALTTSAISLGVEQYDYGNNLAASAYTVPVAGLYSISARVEAGVNNAIQEFNVRIKVNGVERSQGSRIRIDGGVTASPMGSVLSDILALSAGDSVTLNGWQGGGGNAINLATGADVTFMAINKVP